MRSMLLIISVATLYTLCHGSPLGIGQVDLKLRTPEGGNFNPVQFAEEWVDSVSVPVFPVNPVVKNVEVVPVVKVVPVPFRSTPVLVQRESIPEPVVAQNVQLAAIIPEPTVKAAPLVVEPAPVDVESTAKSGPNSYEPSTILVEPVLKPVPVYVELTPIVIVPLKAAHIVAEPASIVVESLEKSAPLVETVVEEVSAVIKPIVQPGPAIFTSAVAPLVKTAPAIVKTVVNTIAPVIAPSIVKLTSVVTNNVEIEPIKTLSFETPYVNIISPAAPIVKNTPAKSSVPILKPIPVVTGNNIQIVESKAEIITDKDLVPIVDTVVPVVKATPQVIVAVPEPLAVPNPLLSTPDVPFRDIAGNTIQIVEPKAEIIIDEYPVPIIAAPVPVVKATPEVIVAVGSEPLDAPNPPLPTAYVPFRGGQFHAQDETGQYAFGHYGGTSTRVEAKDSLGRVSGSFAYVNPDGDVHVRKYSSAPGEGFKVAASDLPIDTPEVAEVKENHAKLIADTRASN